MSYLVQVKHEVMNERLSDFYSNNRSDKFPKNARRELAFLLLLDNS
jgi:hypothetical protein